MQNFTVIIVGAGPGGLRCAALLAEHGVDVLVLERKTVVGAKVCGGGITWKGLIQRVPESLIDRTFSEQHIFTNLQKIRLTSPAPIVATVDRIKLGSWMVAQAVCSGATIMTGCTLSGIQPESVLVVDAAGRELRFGYRYLVGADGSSSRVRKYLRLPTQGNGVGIQYLVPGEFKEMEWHLNTRLLGNGYCWIFPFTGSASIGMYTDGTSLTAKEMLASFHSWAVCRGLNLDGLRPQAGLINYDYAGWRFGNIMLVGDAAGLASGLTGEGMYPAIVSGEAAARSILEPGYQAGDLRMLIRKQQIHRQILAISGKNAVVCSLALELLALGLRFSVIPFSKLEMAD